MDAIASAKALTWPKTRIYIIDNASTDGSEENLRARTSGVMIIQSGSNLGWSGGNNVGIRAALSDGCVHILLLNNDATILPDSLTHLVDAAETFSDVASIGALIVKSDDTAVAEFAGAEIDPRTQMLRQRYGALRELALSPEPFSVVAVKGCAMLLTATGLARVGLLTEDYFLNFDETDWCYRANAAGLRHFMVPRAVVEHKGAVSFGGVEGPLYRYFTTRNRLVFARRHLGIRGRWYAWRAVFWELRQPTVEGVTWLQLYLTIFLAVTDYCRGRLGDCPQCIRTFNRRSRPG